MNNEWSLTVFYEGYDDPSFLKDFEESERLAKRLQDLMKEIEGQETIHALTTIINCKEAFKACIGKLFEYLYLKQATNTTDSETNGYLSKYQKIAASVSGAESAINAYIAGIPEEELKKCMEQSEMLAAYAFQFESIRRDAKYQFSEDIEIMLAKMNLSGGNAWSRLFDYLTSTVKVEYEGGKITLPAVRNLAYDSDKEVRKKAYEAELASYSQIEGSIAFALNSIKSQVNMLSKERGYESPLEMTLQQSNMKRETLDAMFTAIKEYLPLFQKYLKAKARYLGYEKGLPWYELFAPLGKADKKYTLQETKSYLINTFREFSDDMADMMERAFDEEWIDFYPHEGKVGGAFCSEVTHACQSRILTNFNGTFDAVDTLAHELGHAYHSQQVFSHRILNQQYSMQLAETASTFNETHLMRHAMKTATPDEELALLDSFLSGTTQTVCDILSRFLFEDAVFSKCNEQFLMPEDLKEIMLDAQQQAFDDSIDKEYRHPYMWACKVHYYSEELSYYNFPYAFGSLFAMGLYTQFEKEGNAFVEKYKKLLHATSVKSIEETALMAGIDVTKPDFWRESLAAFEPFVNKFVTFM